MSPWQLRTRGVLRALLVRTLPRLALRLGSLSAPEKGLAGEALAARHLRRQGLRVVAQRLATRAGEIDLLARDGADWACVEVKTGRRGRRFRPGQRVDTARFLRLNAAARLVAAEYGGRARVDLVEVALDRHGRVQEIAHYRDLREAPSRRWPDRQATRSRGAGLRWPK